MTVTAAVSIRLTFDFDQLRRFAASSVVWPDCSRTRRSATPRRRRLMEGTYATGEDRCTAQVAEASQEPHNPRLDAVQHARPHSLRAAGSVPTPWNGSAAARPVPESGPGGDTTSSERGRLCSRPSWRSAWPIWRCWPASRWSRCCPGYAPGGPLCRGSATGGTDPTRPAPGRSVAIVPPQGRYHWSDRSVV